MNLYYATQHTRNSYRLDARFRVFSPLREG